MGKKTSRALLRVGLILLALAAGLWLSLSWAAGAEEQVVLKVGATPVPHAEILELIKPKLAQEGIVLQIIEFNDYVQPNLALAAGELDANYFQHIPYLEDFCREHKLDLTYIAKVHIEPMGVYSKKIKSLKELKKGAVVAIPNDATNGGRALNLLAKAGLIALKPGVGITATIFDITRNDLKLKIKELEAAQLPRALPDVDIAVINGNYALPAGLNPVRDALFLEQADSPYANVLAVRRQDAQNSALLKLAKALQSPEVKKFIEQKYKGAIVPTF